MCCRSRGTPRSSTSVTTASMLPCAMRGLWSRSGPPPSKPSTTRVLALARGDIVWHGVSEYFPDDPEGPAEGVNLVELLADTSANLEDRLAVVTQLLEQEGRSGGRRGFTVAREAAANPITPQADVARAFGASTQGSVRLGEDGDEAEGDGVRLAPPETVDAVTRIWGIARKPWACSATCKGRCPPNPLCRGYRRPAGEPCRSTRRVPRRPRTAAGLVWHVRPRRCRRPCTCVQPIDMKDQRVRSR